jgi:hypothetical protein
MLNSRMNFVKYHKLTMKVQIFGYHHCRKMTHEIEELALDGHNYPT